MYLDLHGLYLEDAKKKVYEALKECKKKGDYTLEVCHGYNNGTKIKNWLREETFPNVSHVQESLTNSGVTTLYLKMKLK